MNIVGSSPMECTVMPINQSSASPQTCPMGKQGNMFTMDCFGLSCAQNMEYGKSSLLLYHILDRCLHSTICAKNDGAPTHVLSNRVSGSRGQVVSGWTWVCCCHGYQSSCASFIHVVRRNLLHFMTSPCTGIVTIVCC